VVDNAVIVEVSELNVARTEDKVSGLQFALSRSAFIRQLVDGVTTFSNYCYEVAVVVIYEIVDLVQAIGFIAPYLAVCFSDVPGVDALRISILRNLRYSIGERGDKIQTKSVAEALCVVNHDLDTLCPQRTEVTLRSCGTICCRHTFLRYDHVLSITPEPVERDTE